MTVPTDNENVRRCLADMVRLTEDLAKIGEWIESHAYLLPEDLARFPHRITGKTFRDLLAARCRALLALEVT